MSSAIDRRTLLKGGIAAVGSSLIASPALSSLTNNDRIKTSPTQVGDMHLAYLSVDHFVDAAYMLNGDATIKSVRVTVNFDQMGGAVNQLNWRPSPSSPNSIELWKNGVSGNSFQFSSLTDHGLLLEVQLPNGLPVQELLFSARPGRQPKLREGVYVYSLGISDWTGIQYLPLTRTLLDKDNQPVTAKYAIIEVNKVG